MEEQMSMQFVWTLVVAVPLLLVLVTQLKSSHARRRLPPGPRPWPVLGNLGILGELPHHDFLKLSKRYGPLVYLQLGSVPSIVVSSYQIADEVLRTQDNVFASRQSTAGSRVFGYNDQIMSFAPYGDLWRFTRKVFTSELFPNKSLEKSKIIRESEIRNTVLSVLEQSGGRRDAIVQMNVFLEEFTTNVMTRMAMNKSFLGRKASAVVEGEFFHRSVKDSARLVALFNIGDYIPWLDRFDLQGIKSKMLKEQARKDAWFQGIIDEHRKQLRTRDPNVSGEMDLFDYLLTRPSEANGLTFTDDLIKGFIGDVIIAGIATSSSTIEWALAELLKHPEMMRRAQEELDSAVGRDRLVQESDLPRLPYLLATINETFRLHPAAPLLLPHKSLEPCELAGYHIPANCVAFINVWAIQRDPAVWDRPLEFDPERFLNSAKDVGGKGFDLLTFGAGRRSCPGRNIGVLQVQIGLAVLLHSCDWTLPAGQKPEDLDMSENCGLTVFRNVPLELVATPRLPVSVITG